MTHKNLIVTLQASVQKTQTSVMFPIDYIMIN